MVSVVWCWTGVLQLLKELYLVSGIHRGGPRLALFLIHSGLQKLYNLFILTWPKIIMKWNESELIISHKRTIFLKVNRQGKENGVMENNSKITPNARWCELENSDLNQPRSNSSWIQAYWHWNELGKKKSCLIVFLKMPILKGESFTTSLWWHLLATSEHTQHHHLHGEEAHTSHGPQVSTGLFTTIQRGQTGEARSPLSSAAGAVLAASHSWSDSK